VRLTTGSTVLHGGTEPFSRLRVLTLRSIPAHSNEIRTAETGQLERLLQDQQQSRLAGRGRARRISLPPSTRLKVLVMELMAPVNREVYFALPVSHRRTPLTYSLRRDDSDFVMFCYFSKPEDAEVLQSAAVGTGCQPAAGGDAENKPTTRTRYPGRTHGAERLLM
jgi:hypothetical protein